MNSAEEGPPVGRLREPLVCAALVTATIVSSCAPAIRSTGAGPVPPDILAQLWVAPRDLESRDLFWGPGGPESAPDPNGSYRFVEKDTKGFSPGYDVIGPGGLEWSVKLGPEAQTEVVASRLVWAAGFHQPPTYYLPRWKLEGGDEPGWKGPARFRPKVAWLDTDLDWSWHQNPFVGSQQYRGLLALMLMLNNADLRTPNNKIYTLPFERDGARVWYVVRDLGASLGATGFIYGTRNDIEGFEKQGFIERVGADGRVEFDYHGRHRELLEQLRVQDVQWAAERWDRLSPAHWDAAFRAAMYPESVRRRYAAKFHQKIDQALTLRPRPRWESPRWESSGVNTGLLLVPRGSRAPLSSHHADRQTSASATNKTNSITIASMRQP